MADGFLAVVQRHATAEGDLSEQFDGVTGFQRGARNLTWSYGSFLDAVRGRRAGGGGGEGNGAKGSWGVRFAGGGLGAGDVD